jgi:toxin ParE1/3/4
MKELYALSSFALRDLFEIWDYIRQDDPEAADRVETELLRKCESLARMPGQGHRRPDYTTAHVLFFAVYSYLIAYRPGTDPLQILGFVHGSREVKKILNKRNL